MKFIAGVIVLSLVSMACCTNDPCSRVTDAEAKCIADRAKNAAKDIENNCKGVDFDALTAGNVRGSKICDVASCIPTIDKDAYTPCNRGDVPKCIQSICANCTNISTEEQACMVNAANKSTDVSKQCAGVDLKSLLNKGTEKDLLASGVCDHPGCLRTLRDDMYAPCNRGDLPWCILQLCNNGTCPAVTADQMQCMIKATSTNGTEIAAHCAGVDLELLEADKIFDSKICAHPECLSELHKDVYSPCQRNDLIGCIRQICGDTCTNPTPEEMRCMTDAATNNTHNLTTSCSGVDFTAFNKGEFNKSGICHNPGCLQVLDKVVYAPCSRSDLAACVHEACVCLPVSSDEAECFNDAYTKNETHFKTPCNGVDFLSLQRGDISGSKLCDHTDCSKALDTYVYTPCKRPDIIACFKAGCPN